MHEDLAAALLREGCTYSMQLQATAQTDLVGLRPECHRGRPAKKGRRGAVAQQHTHVEGCTN